MLKTTIQWKNESGEVEEVSSGANVSNAILSVSITECVNSGEELTLGSVCAGKIKASILLLQNNLNLQAGTEISVYRHDGSRNHFVGNYIIEKPTRPTANMINITGYDIVTKLDKDLTSWLSNLTQWPYALQDFARMVCQACGLSLTGPDIPNKSCLVRKFSRDAVTGRQLMQWIGELCCRFCRVSKSDPTKLEFAWYEQSGKSITPTGPLYYFQNKLAYENYETQKIESVQMRMSGSSAGALWPVVSESKNRYVISGNPLLSGSLQADIEPVLSNILSELNNFSYTPCKVSIPANMDLHAGHIVSVIDKNGKRFKTCVMSKTQANQKDTLESTGSYRRDSSTSINAQSASLNASIAASNAQSASSSAADAAESARDAASDAENAAGSAQSAAESASQAAQNAIDNLTHDDVYNKLTNNGTIQGIYVQDGKWYINAELVQVINLIADHVKSIKGMSTLEIDGAMLRFLNNKKETLSVYNYDDDTAQIYLTGHYSDYDDTLIAPGRIGIGGDAGTYPDISLTSRQWGSGGSCISVDQVEWSGDPQYPFKLYGKTVSWKSNGDGTFTLIGT